MKGIHMRKENWYSNNYLFVLAGLAVLAAVMFASNYLCNETQDRASVVKVLGPVSIERAGTKITPTAGMVLNPFDKITTGKGATIDVTYDDGLKDIVQIGSNSHAVLESDVIQKRSSIFLDKGSILLKLEKLEKGSNFMVRTPVAVAGVRGTSFGVQLKGKEAIITDYESHIYVKGLDRNFVENEDELLLSEGWEVKLKQFERPSRVFKIADDKRAVWLKWINEVAALSARAPGSVQSVNPSSGVSSTVSAFTQDTLDCPGRFSAVVMKMLSSASVMAFLLYIALMVNIRKVFV